MQAADIMGTQEIAALLQVQPATVSQWRHRRLLPAPWRTVSGTPLWLRATVEEWARETERMPK
jgi:hypothetical protein